ncbi:MULTISPECIES: NAD(P)-dependent oxidoreductase [Ferrimonas]|uniref:NAD-dependent epimerase/dehydratase family protein n=1 Tax=Ferrimonas TaxID=44011 RepID=UPI00042000B0|nr:MULTISPECIES: SDR family oxidoreductase [Ferrimonas]USD36202.1 SDR family oxidoreductase [Ferrimonas sp. SCSIO 43195]
MPQHVLVTGGAGYIGSILVPKLLARGDTVTVIDSLMWGIGPMLSFLGHPNLSVDYNDARKESNLRQHLKRADTVINLAAIVGYPACQHHPTTAKETNIGVVASLARHMSPSQQLIQASTGSTYGAVEELCTEDTPINPLTLYGETKAEAEKYVLDAQGVPLRFATVFGVSPRMRLDLLVNDIVHQVVHNRTFVMYEGHARRTFLHSTDAANSILFSIDHYDQMKGRPYNVGDESLNFTKLEIAQMVKQQFDYYLHQAEFGEDLDKRDYAVSYQRIRSLGYRASVSMEHGIAELLKACPLIKPFSIYRNF